MTVPTGNGEARGCESADGPGSPLPSRPARAAANNARNADFLGSGPPKDQGGFGTEDMCHDAAYLGQTNEFWSQAHEPDGPPDLMSMGDPGQTFGGS